MYTMKCVSKTEKMTKDKVFFMIIIVIQLSGFTTCTSWLHYFKTGHSVSLYVEETCTAL